MTTFAPRSRLPLPAKLFVCAGYVAVVVAPLVNLLRRGAWNFSEWVGYFSGICLMAALAWFLVKEVSRQMHVTISEQGVTLEVWHVRATWPILSLREATVPWPSVRRLGRSGFTLVLDTEAAERTVNLLLFANPQLVENFAIDKWKTEHGDRAAV